MDLQQSLVLLTSFIVSFSSWNVLRLQNLGPTNYVLNPNKHSVESSGDCHVPYSLKKTAQRMKILFGA